MKKYLSILTMMVLLAAGDAHSSGRTKHGAKGLLEGSLAALGGVATFHLAHELKRSACELRMPGYFAQIGHKDLVWDYFVTLSALISLGYATWTLGSSSKDSLTIYFEGTSSRMLEEKKMREVSQAS